MRKIYVFLIMFSMVSMIFVMAADFTPQGNINLRWYYNITGVPYINATLYYGNGSQLTGIATLTNLVGLTGNWTNDKPSYVPYTGADTNLDLGANNFSVNSSLFFVNVNTGKVGIGTAGPDKLLHLQKTTGGELLQVREDADIQPDELLGEIGFDGTDGAVSSVDASALIRAYSSEIHSVNNKGGYLTFWTKPEDADSGKVATEKMRIEDNGNVGIGTAGPTETLMVNGSFRVQNSSGTLALYVNESTGNVGIGTATPNAPLTFAAAVGDKIEFYDSQSYGIGIQSGLLQIYSDSAATSVVIGHGDNVGSSSFVEVMRIEGDGNVGIGTTGPNASLEVSGDGDTTIRVTSTDHSYPAIELLRTGNAYMDRRLINSGGTLVVGHSSDDGSTWGARFQWPSGGHMLAIGANQIQFRDSNIFINSDPDGQMNIQADTKIKFFTPTVEFTGNVSIGIASPNYTLSIGSADGSDQIGIYHDNANAYFKTDDGSFIFETDEGTNTNTYVQIQGKGTGYGHLRVYDPDNEEFIQLTSNYGIGYLAIYGSSPSRMAFQATANVPITMFEDAASGETQELKIYGYKTDDSKRSLEIGVGVDANDTASFDGVSNYFFDGNIGIGVTDPDTKLEVLHAGNQLKLSFDGTDNAIFAVDTSGDLTITPSGDKIVVGGNIEAQYITTNIITDAGGGELLIEGNLEPASANSYDIGVSGGSLWKDINIDGDIHIGGSAGIGTASPSYPLHVNTSIGGISGWFLENVSAAGFTDRTPYFKGTSNEALDSILNIKSKNNKIDHSTLPDFARVEYNVEVFDVELNKTVEIVEKGRSLGAMVTLLVESIKSLFQKDIELENQIIILQAENQVIKMELCKKDNSYGFCG